MRRGQFLLLASLILPLTAWSYPLDGYEYTGINRLEAFRLAQEGEIRGRKLHPGALLSLNEVDLRLRENPNLQIPPVDEAFQKQIMSILGAKAKHYSISILDLTDREYPVYAEHRAGANFIPGSVGKLLVAMAIFNELARIYPEDTELRAAILRDSMATADAFINVDSHKVPFWAPGQKRITYRRIRVADEASLWTWMDRMLSPSSNAAASMVLKQLILLRHFGQAYPVSDSEADNYFNKTPPKDLSGILRMALDDGVKAGRLDSEVLRQGGFFTREGKRRVPAGGSRGTTREFLKFLLHLEQGKIVDDFSSQELKRLLYLTRKRIRYASSPALRQAAVYFKSGSLYRCRPEPGFQCAKYKGNKLNLLNSVAIIEAPAGAKEGLYYMVVVTSNILRKNAAVEHQSLATFIHRLIQRRHPVDLENHKR